MLGGALVVAAVLFVGVVFGVTLLFSEADKSGQFPTTGESPLRVVAIGGSWTSGEGAAAFFPGSDRPGRNQCRRAGTSYPFLVAALLEPPAGHDGVELISVACSGARTTNVIAFDDLECSDEWFPDGCPQPQYEYAADGRADPGFQIDRLPQDADVVLVSIGAHDAQFGDVIALCAETKDSCRSLVQPWLDGLDVSLGWRLQRVFSAVRARAPNATIVAMTYPIPLFRDACRSTRLDQDETDFIIDTFVPRLNELVTASALATRAEVVDLSDVFGGHRLCQPDRPGGDRPEIAMNAFQVQPVRGVTWKLSNWFHGSFYPNEYGHELIAARVAREVNELLQNHGANQATPPAPEGIAPAFAAGPAGVSLVASDSACGDHPMETRTMARPIRAEIALSDVDAFSTVCYRPISGHWKSIDVRSAPEVTVPLAAHDTDGYGGWHEIQYETNGSWVRLVVVAPAGSDTASLPLARAWLWPWLQIVGGIVAVPLIFLTLIALTIGGTLMWCTRRQRPEE